MARRIFSVCWPPPDEPPAHAGAVSLSAVLVLWLAEPKFRNMITLKEIKPTKTYSVPAIHRTLDIIEALVRQRSLTISEMNRNFHIPKSSVYAILQTLKARGYVERDENDRYSLTLRLFSIGSSLIELLDFRQELLPMLKELSDKTQITAHLAVLDDGYAVYVEKVEVLRALRLSTWVGRRMPVHSTSIGKCLIAYLTTPELVHIVAARGLPQLTPRTITSLPALQKELALVRKQGYAIANEENESGVRAVAAPIFNSTGNVVAAVNLGATTLQIRPKDLPQLGEVVRGCARRMSAQMGYREAIRSRKP